MTLVPWLYREAFLLLVIVSLDNNFFLLHPIANYSKCNTNVTSWLSLLTLRVYLHISDLVAKSYLTLCDPMDCSPSNSSVHGILQARILEWVAISFSRKSSCPRDQTRVSWIAGRFFTSWAMRQDLTACEEHGNLWNK